MTAKEKAGKKKKPKELAVAPRARVVRVLLENGVTVDEVYQFAYRRDYFVHQVGDRRKGQPAEDIWRTMDQRAWLHLVDDTHVHLRYLTIRGGDVDAIAAAAAEEMRVVAPSTALAGLKDAGERIGAIVYAIYVVAVASSSLPKAARQRSAVIAALNRSLKHEDADVRRAVIVGTGYLGWPELRSALERVERTDADEAVRKDAKLMLQSFDAAD